MKELRPRQAEVIDLLRQSLAGGLKRVLVKAPTGFGKTVIASNLIRMAREKGKRVIFCVNAISLVDQTAQRFCEEGLTDIGVIQGSHELTNYAAPIQIASVQTLQRRRTIPPADLVIIDEIHNLFKFYFEWAEQWNNVPFIGLSATPYTKGLGKLFQHMIVNTTTEDLIREGLLSPFRVYAPSHPDLKGVRTVAGDYHEGDLAKAMDKAPLVADVVTMWLRYGENRPTLCYGVNRAHAKHIQTEFLGKGITCGYIDSFTELPERRDIADKFHSGELKVICNVGVLTTGIDWDVRCIILARPTKSEMLFQQITGRGLRTAEGKEDLVIIDHSDTHLRLGFVTDIDEKYTSLDDGEPKDTETLKKEKETPLPKECPACHYLKPAKMHECPKCHFKPEKVSGVEHMEGELIEISGTKANRADNVDKKSFFLAELKRYASEKGYKEGWAANKYREKYGVWPNKIPQLAPRMVSLETANWIRSSNIRNAKGRENGRKILSKLIASFDK